MIGQEIPVYLSSYFIFADRFHPIKHILLKLIKMNYLRIDINNVNKINIYQYVKLIN